MKKLINNPKSLAIISIALIIISFIIIVITLGYFKIEYLFYFSPIGGIVLLLYFILIISKKHLNLNILNTIVLVSFIVSLILKNRPYFGLFIPYTIFIILLIIYLGIIFFCKNKNIVKPNIMCILCILAYIIYLISSAINVSILENINLYIKEIVLTLYYIPTILYFRLYGLHKLKEMEVKKWKIIFLTI